MAATLQVLFDRLASREFLNLFRARNHDDKLLRRLKLILLGLNKVLNDAEDKQINDQAVNDWVKELKDAVYHADDLVDQIATEALRCKVEAEYHSGPNQVRPPISTSSSLFDAEIESKLGEIIDTLDDFSKEKDVLGLRDGVGQNWSHTLPTTSLVDESGVFGRNTDKEEIMKLLISGAECSNQIDVILIVGMGGVGKTTLAQLLFNDGRVDDRFDMKAWVCVSDIFDVLRVTRTIVEAVTGQSCDEKDLNSLQVKLKESLSRRRFLIVLDDVWNENYRHWDVLMTPLRFGAHGSRIVVTTCNDSVASIIKTVPVYRLQELEAEDCWKLFSNHAFGNGDSNAHPSLEHIGRQIVEKCKGLPLAAKTLGGLLCSTREVEDWNTILKSSIWDLPKEKSNILPALRLSYHYLPSHLKRCFAYCSIYPKDYEFDMKELVLTWIAEGFVERPKSSKTVEEQGYECFRELLSRSFFQRPSADKSCFVVHDLVHDLAQFIAGHFYSRLEDDKPHSISEKLRHLSYVQGTFDGFERFKVIEEAKFLRTFLPLPREIYKKRWLSKKVLTEILPRLTCLRLLSLSRYEIMELPHSIGNLIHLRFLDLSYTRINQLPDSVCSLYNLETMLLSHCRCLETLPADIGKLISLRHLDLSETNLKEMPMKINRLKDLQELTAFVVGKCSRSGISELKEFHHLRGTISISGLQNVTSAGDALEAKMREKKHLEKLVLEWGISTDDSENERDVLDKLQPHTNLKHLEIKNYGGTRFPDWLGDRSFCKMVSLCLENCEYCFSLPPLGQLPSLKELTIARMKGITNVGDEFYGESGSLSRAFQSLETLRFEEMSEWVEWLILDGVEFSRLQKLEVIECPKLKGGLPKHIPSLERLEIKECPELVASLPRTTSIRELELNNCCGMELGWQSVSSVETLTISGFAGLKELTSELFSLTNLKKLMVQRCPSLVSFPHTGLPPMLTELTIRDCEAMQHFSEGIMRLNNLRLLYVELCPELVFPLHEEMRQCYRNLEILDLLDCHGLESLPLGFFPKLRRLYMYSCKNFETLLIPNGGPGFQNLTFLETVFISDCENMVSFPPGGLPAPNLFWLVISDCKKLKALPEQMHTLLPSLQSLFLEDCPEIESFPEGGLPSKLLSLKIRNCEKLVGNGRRRDWGLQTLPSLKHFTLACKSGGDLVESFPEEGLLPSSLTSLRIGSLRNLKSLNKRGLRLLGSLKYMRIEYCGQLQSLPEDEEGGGKGGTRNLIYLGLTKTYIKICKRSKIRPKKNTEKRILLKLYPTMF